MYNERLRINQERFISNFDSISKIGATIEGGINQTAFCEGHQQVRKLFLSIASDYGLIVKVDGAGNHIARLEFDSSETPTMVLGSRLDSVPNGGKFDGALGVIAALEVLLTIKESKTHLPFNLEAIDFTDEEGTFIGFLGSTAIGGKLTSKVLASPRGGRDIFLEKLQNIRITDKSLLISSRNPTELAGYLELHIEQGSRLEIFNGDIGIVTSIVGIGSYNFSFLGRADHAGTTSMNNRLDAAQGAASFTVTAKDLVTNNFPECVCITGNMEFFPGVFNIVPEEVCVSFEFRAPEQLAFKELDSAIITLAEIISENHGLRLLVRKVGEQKPSILDNRVINIISQVSDKLKLKSIRLPSGAGYDAQSFSDICPTGMIFVPSANGSSHSPREFAKFEDCINGANVLLHSTLTFASSS
jgi:N-carbamoyl-L-amino-acid hydrolase